MSKVINKTKGTQTVSLSLAEVNEMKKKLEAQYAEQLAQLKSMGAGKYSTWTSKTTGKVYLNLKLEKGKPILLSRPQIEQIIREGQAILKACDELKID
jgi:L-rhamnose mutarotase